MKIGKLVYTWLGMYAKQTPQLSYIDYFYHFMAMTNIQIVNGIEKN